MISVGWVEALRNPTFPGFVGFRSSNASCYNGGNPRNALAPQPTLTDFIISNHPNLILKERSQFSTFCH
ncbi:hypothetical protein LC593_11915 [Nostoc sp. CHAB 5844]|nr:hypothetical protein [Nostoc sp. CHAB 5844]